MLLSTDLLKDGESVPYRYSKGGGSDGVMPPPPAFLSFCFFSLSVSVFKGSALEYRSTECTYRAELTN